VMSSSVGWASLGGLKARLLGRRLKMLQSGQADGLAREWRPPAAPLQANLRQVLKARLLGRRSTMMTTPLWHPHSGQADGLAREWRPPAAPLQANLRQVLKASLLGRRSTTLLWHPHSGQADNSAPEWPFRLGGRAQAHS